MGLLYVSSGPQPPRALPSGKGILGKGNGQAHITDPLDLPHTLLPRGSPAPRRRNAAAHNKKGR